LSGLDSTTLKPLVEQAMPTLIELMYDQCVVVRDTVAWTFGRICEIVPDAAINETYLKPLLEAFVNGLKQEPRVAANVCWAFAGTLFLLEFFFPTSYLALRLGSLYHPGLLV